MLIWNIPADKWRDRNSRCLPLTTWKRLSWSSAPASGFCPRAFYCLATLLVHYPSFDTPQRSTVCRGRLLGDSSDPGSGAPCSPGLLAERDQRGAGEWEMPLAANGMPSCVFGKAFDPHAGTRCVLCHVWTWLMRQPAPAERAGLWLDPLPCPAGAFDRPCQLMMGEPPMLGRPPGLGNKLLLPYAGHLRRGSTSEPVTGLSGAQTCSSALVRCTRNIHPGPP